jgi:hypothetical protein
MTHTSASPFPELDSLQAILRSLMRCPELVVTARKPGEYMSTFLNEVVRLRLPGGCQPQVLLKYGAGHQDNVYGHRGGVPYEAMVYRDILQRVSLPLPALHGAHLDSAGETWLALEYIDGAERLEQASHPEDGMVQAAQWAGSFHRQMQGTPEIAKAAVARYDAAYYRGWMERAVRFAGQQHTWLRTLQARFGEVLECLLEVPRTIIHGEYYPKNILLLRGKAYPVDWESVAWAAGEIDLASLIEGWDTTTAGECRRAYCEARWPRGTPPEFERTLGAATIYQLLRWTGDRPEWTVGEEAEWQFGELRAMAQRLGVL